MTPGSLAANSKIYFAIVGFGNIGQRYARMISVNPYSILSAIVDVHENPPISPAFQKIRIYHSLKQLLKSDTKVDVVIIASPNSVHASQAEEALAAGKDIIIEKPLALSIEEAEVFISKAKEVNRRIFPISPGRYSPIAKKLKDFTNSGKLGKIFFVQFNCFWNRDDRYYNNSWRGKKDLDGGPLFTQFYHFIDLLYWVFGDIFNIQARFSNFNHQGSIETEDSGFIQFRLDDGGLGSINYTTSVWDRNLESSVTIIAENGSIKIAGQYLEKVEVSHIKGIEDPFKDIERYMVSGLYNHQQQLDEIITALKKGTAPGVTAEEAKKVIDIICRIYAQRTI